MKEKIRVKLLSRIEKRSAKKVHFPSYAMVIIEEWRISNKRREVWTNTNYSIFSIYIFLLI